jgi:hypothetical protein
LELKAPNRSYEIQSELPLYASCGLKWLTSAKALKWQTKLLYPHKRAPYICTCLFVCMYYKLSHIHKSDKGPEVHDINKKKKTKREKTS